MMFSIEQLKNEYSVYQKTDISDNFKEFEENYAITVQNEDKCKTYRFIKSKR